MQVPSEPYAQPLSKDYYQENESHCMLFTISSLKVLYSPMMDIDHYMINQDYTSQRLSTKNLYAEYLDRRTQRF